MLRKTNFDPHKTLRKHVPSPSDTTDEDSGHKFDFRAVLKKKNMDKEETRLRKHILT